MEVSDYISIARGFGAHRYLGQNFLVNEEIARKEAAYAKDLNVVELGPGLGILTRQLCAEAKSVIAIEKDERLFNFLKENLNSKRLRLINADFFDVDLEALGRPDIMVSNIPYNLSSKVIYWLAGFGIPAVLCIQKEFARHMLAIPGSRDYSKLSVASRLGFSCHSIRDVAAGNFYPMPGVDSCIVYLAPRKVKLDNHTMHIISLIMSHKKKRLRNAIADSYKELGLGKSDARKLADTLEESGERPFKLGPEKLLAIARQISKLAESE